MKKDEVFELIHQNGIGQNIECSFSSKGKNNEYCISAVNNYKYQNGLIKMYIDRFHMQKYEKNLTKHLYGVLTILKEDNCKNIILKLSCRYLKVDDKFIHAEVLSVKYIDDEGKEVNQRIITN